MVALAHTGRYAFGVWDTSYMESNTETIGRLIHDLLALDSGRMACRVNWKPLARCWTTKVVMPLGNHLTTFGGQYLAGGNASMVSRRGNLNFTQNALFAEDEWSLADTFKLTLGGTL